MAVLESNADGVLASAAASVLQASLALLAGQLTGKVTLPVHWVPNGEIGCRFRHFSNLGGKEKNLTPNIKQNTMSCTPNTALGAYDKQRTPRPTYLGQNEVGGFLGSYVPSEQYVDNCYATGCSGPAQQLQAACNNSAQVMGPCAAGWGLSSDQLFPSSLDPCDGFSATLVSAPLDFLYADTLLDCCDVLTTTKNQSYDLRGEPTTAPAFSCDQNGNVEAGPFGGYFLGNTGNSPYDLRKCVRTYIV
jgi:hypothetical protein